MAIPEQTPAPQAPDVFAVKDCALLNLSGGRRALTLRELRDGLVEVQVGSLYHHFWGGLLAPRFEEREYNNDFAAWARHGLHDAPLAERLAMLDPTEHADLEALRGALLDAVEERLDESEALAWTRASRPFDFIHSQIVVFDTHRRLSRPEELAEALPHLSAGSIFYHFIDARRRAPHETDDFREWLAGFGERYADLIHALAGVDPFFGSLTELRATLASLCAEHFGEARP
jgi:hypothetical protein